MKISRKFLSVPIAFLLILALAGTASASNTFDGTNAATITNWTNINSAADLSDALGKLNNHVLHTVTFQLPNGLPNATQLGFLQPLLFSSLDPSLPPTQFHITGLTASDMEGMLAQLGCAPVVTVDDYSTETVYTLTLDSPIPSPPHINYTLTIGGYPFPGYYANGGNWPAPYGALLAGRTATLGSGNDPYTMVIRVPKTPTTRPTPRPTSPPTYNTPTPTATPAPTTTPTPGDGGTSDGGSSYDKGYWMYPSVFGSSTTTTTPSTDSTVSGGSGTVTAPQQMSAPRFLLLGKGLYAGKTKEVTKAYSSTYAKASLVSLHKNAAVIIWGGAIYNTANDSNWRRVLLSDQRVGYVRETSLQPYSKEKPSVLLANIYSDARFYEITKSSNIFDKIATDRTPIGVASRGTVVAIYDESGKYSYVQCGKVKGWVQTSALRAIDVSTYKLK